MKKILFATTALVATAGVAAADVAVSGSAEMGLFGGTGDETQFFTDIDVTFTMSGTTDNGLTFGAAVDLDEGGEGAAAVADNADDGGVAIFLSGDFGTVTLGDTDGALDWALTEAWVGNAGSIADDETSHAGALGSYGDGAYDGQILRYNNTFGDFGVAISVEMDDAGVRDVGYAIGFQYGIDITGGSLSFGLGYQTTNHVADAGAMVTIFDVDWDAGDGVAPGDSFDTDIIGFSVSAAFDNGLSAGLQYSEWSTDGFAFTVDTTHIGVGVGYTFDAITVSANWGQFDLDGYNIDGGTRQTGYGLAAAYDLGGGASIHLGYGASDNFDGTDTDSFSFGLAMSF